MNDRLVTGRPIDDDIGFEVSLRPRRLDEFVGQPQVKANLRVAIEAARARGEALDHVLLYRTPRRRARRPSRTIIAARDGAPIKATAGPGDRAAPATSPRC